MEDREGNLWVGTETDGLHILRDQRFRTVGAREGLSSDATTTVVEDAAGTLWVGTSDDGLNAIPRGALDVARPVPSTPNAEGAAHPIGARKYTVRDGLLSDVILSLAAAKDGSLWVGTPDGLNRIRAGHVDGFTSADGLPDDFIRSLLADADGSLWIGTRRGLAHWKRPGTLGAGAMEILTTANGLGSDLVGAMARDGKGDLWVATLAGLSRIHEEAQGQSTVSNYTTKDGLSSNVITALEPEGESLLIGTQDHGWNLWDGHSFGFRPGTEKETRSWMEGAGIHAILDDGWHRRWFATANGIAMCTRLTIGLCGQVLEFGPADGLRGRETATNSHPSAWRAHDGHLWFATPKGLVEVDPAHFPVNSTPPPVALERFTVDDVLRSADKWSRVEAGHVHFEFDYAALSFVAPQKVRYRLRAWTRPGLRPVRAARRTTQTFRRGSTPSACRLPTTTACGTRKAPRSSSSFARTSIKRCGFTCCWRPLPLASSCCCSASD